MKFVELKKNLSQEILPIYLIKGQDNFLCESCINLVETKLFGNIIKNNLNKQTFGTENLDIKKFLDNLNTMPFFAERKMVVLKEEDTKNSSEIISCLKEYASSPNKSTVLMVYCLPESDFFKPLMQKCETVDCSKLDLPIIKKWILNKLASCKNDKVEYQINNDALDTLINYTNGYLTKIDKELDKLMAYSQGLITNEMVIKLVPKDLEYSIFELTDCIANCNTQKAELIKQDLMNSRKTISALLPLFQSYFRRLFYSLVSEGTPSEIANSLNVKEYAIIKAQSQAKKFGAKTLKKLLELLADLDYKTKSSQISLENAIELIIKKSILFMQEK